MASSAPNKSPTLAVTACLALLLSPIPVHAIQWAEVNLGAFDGASITNISGSTSSNVYFGGSAGSCCETIILRYDGLNVTQMSLPAAIAASGANPFGMDGDLAVGSNFVLQKGPGDSWSEVNINTSGILAYRDVSVSPSGGLAVVVGNNGHINRREGGVWTSFWNSGSRYSDVYVPDDSHYYYTPGSGGLFFRYYDSDQGAWVSGSGFSGWGAQGITIWDVWGDPSGSSAGEMYTTGSNTIGHFVPGSGWTLMAHPKSNDSNFRFSSIFHDGSTLYAYGSNSFFGTVLRLDNNTWTDVSPQFLSNVYDLWGNGDDLFVSDSSGNVWHSGADVRFAADFIQTIQDPASFVTGKPIHVRAYVTCPGCPPNTPGTVQVTLTADTLVETINGQLSFDPGFTVVDLRESDLNSFNFTIPASEFETQTSIDKTIVLDFEVTTSLGVSTRQINRTITVEPMKPLVIGLVRVDVQTMLSGFVAVSEINIANAKLITQRLYPGEVIFKPTQRITFDLSAFDVTDGAQQKVFRDQLVTKVHELMMIGLRDNPSVFSDIDYLYGIFATEAALDGVAFAYYWPGQPKGYAAIGSRMVMAHEVGHLLGLSHPAWEAVLPVPPDGFAQLEGQCPPSTGFNNRMTRFVDWPNYNWPYSDPLTHVYGYSPSSKWNYAKEPTLADMMSYCDSDQSDDIEDMKGWISEIHYNRLLTHLLAPSRPHSEDWTASKSLGKAVVNSDYLLVTAVIHDDDTVTDLGAEDYSNSPPFPRSSTIPSGTNYCVETWDSGNNALDQQCFELAFVDPERGESVAQVSLKTFLNADPAITQVVVKKGAAILATLAQSANAPVISNFTADNDTPGQSLLCWTSTDSDPGDGLSHTIQYSADLGGNWQTLEIGWMDGCYSADHAMLAASDSGRFRLIASDGFNSTSAETAGTTVVGDQGPIITLNHTQTIVALMLNERLLLSASAYDLEDGEIPGADLVWSDESGTPLCGIGSPSGAACTGEVLVSASHQGEEFTITATDSDNNSNQQQVTLLLVEPIFGDGFE